MRCQLSPCAAGYGAGAGVCVRRCIAQEVATYPPHDALIAHRQPRRALVMVKHVNLLAIGNCGEDSAGCGQRQRTLAPAGTDTHMGVDFAPGAMAEGICVSMGGGLDGRCMCRHW